LSLKTPALRSYFLFAVSVTANARVIAGRPTQEFDYHKPFYIIWFGIGFILMLAVLSYFVMGSPSRDDPSKDLFWRGGIFYVNPDDPMLFVQKRFGIGHTLNFGNPWSWAVLTVIVLAAAIPFFCAFWSIHSFLIQKNAINSVR